MACAQFDCHEKHYLSLNVGSTSMSGIDVEKRMDRRASVLLRNLVKAIGQIKRIHHIIEYLSQQKEFIFPN